MNPLLSPEPDDVVSSRPRTHWVDTNVMLEVYSHGDLYTEVELADRGLPADPEKRRVRMRGSLWLAMALASLRASTVSYRHENERNILRIAPPGTDRGNWTAAVVYVLGDGGVFSGWERLLTGDGATLSNRDRDRNMVRECASNSMALVTRDVQVIGEARALGVDCDEPEPIAARTMTREAGRSMFAERLGAACARYAAVGDLAKREQRIMAADRVADVYAALWAP